MQIPDLTDIPELGPVPGNTEYDLRVIKSKEVVSNKTGREGIMLILEIVGEENAKNVFHRLWLPNDSDEPSKAQTMWRMIKEFMVALGMPTDGASAADFEGLQFSAILKVVTDENGRESNEIARVT